VKREVEGDTMSITILRFTHEHVAHCSYLLVEPKTKTAVVIDPYRNIDPYMEAASWMSSRIRHVFLTQQHDDFQGGHRTLQERTGAMLYAGAWTRPPFDFLPVKNGDVLEFGQLRLMILETPGHRLEGIAVLAFDLLSSDSEPFAAFTGDTLTLGYVGLPEAKREDGLSTIDLARMLHDSIRHKILTLPPSTRIYPALSCLNTGDPETRPIDENLLKWQRVQNPALRPMYPNEFEAGILEGMRRGPFLIPEEDRIRIRPVSATEMLRAARSGAQVIDVRPPADFAAVHLEKSLNVPVVAAFESWAGAVLDPDEPAILIAPPGQEQEAALRLEAAGVALVAGFLKGGMQALEDRMPLLRSDRRYSLPGLEEALLQAQAPQLIEIDRPEVSATGLGIPLEHLRSKADALSRDREIVICSETAFRASAGASLLRHRGFPRVRTLAGGLAMWGRRPTPPRTPAHRD
jgi:glyoxylase-like metal-dependent hydrolase (beta-lactamase superfamily II)/rhodanese-related sulfurtransferase